MNNNNSSFKRLENLMGLYYNWGFFEKADERLKEIKDTYSLVAIDIEHFRLFNKLYGRDRGDELLLHVAKCVKEIQDSCNGVGGYLGGDNFAILMPGKRELLEKLEKDISAGIEGLNNRVGFLPAFGVYLISDMDMQAVAMYDRATIALSQVRGAYVNRICEYNSEMVDELEEELVLLSEVQKALEKEEFTFYVQPQCDISTGKIVGGGQSPWCVGSIVRRD